MTTTKIYKSITDAARVGNIDKLNCLFSKHTDQSLRSHALAHASHYGLLECVKFMVPQCSNNEVYISGLIRAIHRNQSECINYLLPFFTQPFDCRLAIDTAVAEDNVELVKHFIPLCNQKFGPLALIALITAINKGNREMFDVLLSVSEPEEWGHVLYCAVEANRTEFFDSILSKPIYDYCASFVKAVELGCTDLGEFLYPFIDIQEVDKYIRDVEPYSYEKFYENFYPLEAKMQKGVLNDNIDEQTLKGVVRKM